MAIFPALQKLTHMRQYLWWAHTIIVAELQTFWPHANLPPYQAAAPNSVDRQL